jgi:LacI family transcriptional regulator
MRSKRLPKQNRVTVRGIAEAAGVSIGSVSTVLNNRHVERRITIETVEKVRAAAAKLGYVPNISARQLRSQTPEKNNAVIALVTSYEAPLNLVRYFPLALQQAVAANEARFTCSLMIEMFSSGKLRELPGLLTGNNFNAAIITNTTPEDDIFLSRTHLPFPAVLVNRLVTGYSSVIEDPNSGAQAADVLIRAKRKRLAVLHGTPLTQSTQTRVDSFIKRTTELTGQPAREILALNLTEDGYFDAMNDFLANRANRIDGLYCVIDGGALGAFHAIKSRGLKIPSDLAVVGVGDYDVSRYFDPPLSTIGASQKKTSDAVARLIMRQLTQSPMPQEQMVVPAEVTLRASTGK